MRILYATALAVLIAGQMAGVSPRVHAATPSPEARKIERLLKGAGLTYERRKPTVWTVAFTARKLGKSTVIVTYDRTLLVTFAIVARHAALDNTPRLMETLLRADNDFDYAKIGYDRDGDLIVRVDAPLRLTDARQLKYNIEQVMSVADRLFEEIAPFVRP